MKKTLTLIAVVLFAFTAFSQKSISNEIFDFVKTINSLAIGKKIDIDNNVLNKHIRNMPGAAALDRLIKDYESKGKWLSDGITIPAELKPFINVNGDTLVYSSKMNADLETAAININVKAYIVKVEGSTELESNFYLDYTVLDAEGNTLLNMKMTE